MKHYRLVFLILTVACCCWPLAAQDVDWCTHQGWHSDGMVNHNEVREEHMVPNAGETLVDPSQNGSIKVHGWNQADVMVKACVQSAARSEDAAAALAKQVTVTDGPGRIVAKGPRSADHAWWSVSYEIWVPAAIELTLHANNGSIHVENTSGKIQARTQNGSLKLKDVSGEVDGETTNGSVSIEMAGASLHGNGLHLRTTNGSIHLQLPATMGAEVEASTVNGKVHSDFGNVQNSDDQKDVKFTIGAGGPKIEAETTNGSVQISRQS